MLNAPAVRIQERQLGDVTVLRLEGLADDVGLMVRLAMSLIEARLDGGHVVLDFDGLDVANPAALCAFFARLGAAANGVPIPAAVADAGTRRLLRACGSGTAGLVCFGSVEEAGCRRPPRHHGVGRPAGGHGGSRAIVEAACDAPLTRGRSCGPAALGHAQHPPPVASSDVDPVAVLERVAYCLDRVLTESYRVQAYVKAADTIRALPPGELEERHAEGTLTELPGIGPKTGSLIAQALDGGPIPYLEELERTTTIAAADPGAGELRTALRGDCHTHSTWSDGGASIETMARAAMALGHEWIVMTDHSPRLTIAHGLSPERLRQQLAEIAELNERLAPFRILTGMEVDILVDGELDLPEDMLAALDVVVASVHSKISMPRTEMTTRMVLAVTNPHVDVLGHCTGRKVPGRMRQVGKSDFGGRKGAEFDAELVFAACAQYGTAVEINCRPERQDPPDDLLDLALEWGCRIAIDTDAHAPGQLEWQPFGCEKAVAHGVDPGDVINTMTADDLLAWAAA